MAYQPGSFTSRGYTPGMSDDELRKRKIAAVQQRQSSMPPVNSQQGLFTTAIKGLVGIPSMIAAGHERAVAPWGAEFGGGQQPVQPVGQAPATAQQPYPKYPQPLPAFANKALYGTSGAMYGTTAGLPPAKPNTGIGPTRVAAAGIKQPEQPYSQEAIQKRMQERYAAFDAKTNANYQAMRDRMAQGKPGYTAPRVERMATANNAAQVQMVQEREKGNAAEDTRKQNAAMELGKQAGEYRMKEQELQNKGIVAASDVKAAAIMAGIDEKAANKLTPKDAADVYSKLIETLDPTDNSPEAQAKRSLAEKMRGVLEGAAGGKDSSGIPVLSPEEAAKLPKGSKFRTTDGRTMTR